MRYLLLAMLLSTAASAYGPYDAQLVRVVDGDTIELGVELWPGLIQRVNIRLDGINTPEKRINTKKIKDQGKRDRAICEKIAGVAATEFTQAFVEKGSITVDDVRNGKFTGRVLGNVFVDGNSLADALLASGHARLYGGGKRQPWCD
ncbi:MAG: thermonuclease family protein [Porticoccaceae bacterium]|nr:thermonuclease family protein [Porticoccaceae bacterium]